MKKVLSIVLAIAMIATMGVVAFAADTGSANAKSTTIDGASTAEVKGTYAVGSRTDMFKVDVVWGSMEFTYTESAETWNVDTHTWDVSEGEVGTWACETDANKVTLTNHSSKAVTVTLTWADDVADDGDLTGNWAAGSVALDVCEEGGEAPTGSDTLTITGRYTNEEATENAAKIGTVTATIA